MTHPTNPIQSSASAVVLPVADRDMRLRLEALETLMSGFQDLAQFARVIGDLQAIPAARRKSLREPHKDVIIDAVGKFADALRDLSGKPGTDGEPEMTRAMTALFTAGAMIDDMKTQLFGHGADNTIHRPPST